MLVVLPIQGTPSSEPHSLPLISPQGTGTATSLPFNPAKQIFAFSWLAQLNWSLAVRITDTFKFAWNTSTYFEDGLQNILESRTLLLSLSMLHWFYLPVLILLASFPSCAIFLVNLQVTISAKDWLHSNHFSPSFPLWIDVLCVALVQDAKNWCHTVIQIVYLAHIHSKSNIESILQLRCTLYSVMLS